eukprot:jgi/Mesvir1/13304/Mv08594-RA.1
MASISENGYSESMGGDVFSDMVCAFTKKTAELKMLAQMRTNDNSRIFGEDLANLDLSVRAMEQQMKLLRAHLREEADMKAATAELIQRASFQKQKLQHITSRLPVRLPGAENIVGAVALAEERGAVDVTRRGAAEENTAVTSQAKDTTAVIDEASKLDKKTLPPPKAYITISELESVSSYMRGRLTQEKINMAVDEMALFAEETAKQVKLARAKPGPAKNVKPVPKRALELKTIAGMPGVKGNHFFVENDLRNGQILKLDNTGKTILTVLRHLGRILEVPVKIVDADGQKTVKVYVLATH